MRIHTQTVRKSELFRVFLVCITVAISLLVGFSQASAEILLQDDFEDAAYSDKLWGFKNPGGFGVVIDPSKAYTGSGVLQLRYNPGSVSAGFEIATIPPKMEIYHRWYQKWSANWVWDPVSTKVVYDGPQKGGPGFFFIVPWGNGLLQADCQNAGDCDYNPNKTATKFQPNRWYCIEVHVKQSRPGQADGLIQIWIDDVLATDYRNQDFGATTVNPYSQILISGYYNKGAPQLQFSWHDDHVVSTDRNGCLPDTADKTGPKAPTGVRIETQ